MKVRSVLSNPYIERTFQGPLRAPCAVAPLIVQPGFGDLLRKPT